MGNVPDIVDASIYTREYFLTDNEGCREYLKGLDDNIHPKFEKALGLSGPSGTDSVLDVGCGRGEMVYYCAKKGAAALGIDYSRDAIELAGRTIAGLPEEARSRARAEVGEIATYDFREKFTIVFMIEIVEHMHDWQLADAFNKISGLLSDGGRLIILTPNYYYDKYLSPMKRLANLPFNLIKWPLRILRGKYTPKSPGELFVKMFRIKVDRGELNRRMHVNVSTPAKLKNMLKGFDVDIRCEDYSKNALSLLTRRWWGRDIVIVAKKRR